MAESQSGSDGEFRALGELGIVAAAAEQPQDPADLVAAAFLTKHELPVVARGIAVAENDMTMPIMPCFWSSVPYGIIAVDIMLVSRLSANDAFAPRPLGIVSAEDGSLW